MRARILGFMIITIIAAALICSASAHVQHSIPKNQLKKRQVRHPVKHQLGVPFVSTFDAEQEAYLAAHNDHRRKVGVQPLEWDPILTASAHQWAHIRSADCNYRSHSSNSYGENIYWKQYHEFSPRDVVQWWYDENQWYDNTTHSCVCHPQREGCECGHYLNIIWSTTRRVGCSGAVYCDDQQGVFVVCDYFPAGLTPGINPFTGEPLPGGFNLLNINL